MGLCRTSGALCYCEIDPSAGALGYIVTRLQRLCAGANVAAAKVCSDTRCRP